MRWLFHILTREAYDTWLASNAPSYAPASLAREGFVHASYRDAVAESARLYFPPGVSLCVLRIDPRQLDARVEDEVTPRGPMPHIYGPVARAAITAVLTVDDLAHEADQIPAQSA